MNESPRSNNGARHIESAALLVGSATNSIRDAPRTAAANQNANANSIAGPVGTLFNNNSTMTTTTTTNYNFHGNLPKGSDAIQAKISAILQSRYVVRAVYGAQIEKGCMKGTRVQVLLEIEAWIKDLKGPQIFWLAGMAGMGKSAIAWTVCDSVNDDPNIVLAGNFFCSRSTGLSEQRDARCIIPTLAQLLALQSAKFAEALVAELTANPDVLEQQVGVQVKTLLYKPLLALKDSVVPIVFVIDALDECGGLLTGNGVLDDAEAHRVVSDMLDALVTFSSSAVRLPVKFFVTSRPETHIRETHVSDISFSKVLRLHLVDKQQVTADLRRYISNRLLASSTLRALFTQNDVETLVGLCDGLFIVAAVALEHALGAGIQFAAARFRSLLNASRDRLSIGVTASLDHMYSVIVEDAAKIAGAEVEELDRLRRILAALLSARMTLSIAALADLLDVPVGQLRASMTRLHAVINIPDEDGDASLRPIHASFGDYLLGRASDHIRISETHGHDALTHGCFHVLEKRLHFNISRSRSSFELNSTVVPIGITLSLRYACLQWIYHVSSLLESSTTDPGQNPNLRSRFLYQIQRTLRSLGEKIPDRLINEIDEKIHTIIRPRLLFWLEVMSVLGQIQRASAMLMFAAATVQMNDLSRFLRDANSFVASSQEAIAKSAPHIYLSALPFADKDSLVYQDFWPLCTGLISVSVSGIAHHAGRLVMTLPGHEGAITSVTYSPDGRLLASASVDGTVRIWDVRTGDEMGTPLRSGDGTVWSVAFAPDARSVVSGTENGAVCMWILVAAHVSAQRFIGHSAAVSSAAISPRGSCMASASLDNTVRLWNFETKQQLAVVSHSDKVYALAFAANGRTLVTGSKDRTIRLWDIGKNKFTNNSPYRHEHAIHSLCFIPNGRIAAGCGPNIILCKPQSGKPAKLLYTASSPIVSINKSSDGLSLVSVCEKSVCLTTLPRFRLKTSTVVLDGPTETTCHITLSPNGLYMISASEDRTIRIWNAGSQVQAQPVATQPATAQPGAVRGVQIKEAASSFIMSESRELMGHNDSVSSVFVSPDGAFIVSGSSDRSVRIWDAHTGAAMLHPLLGHTNLVYFVNISSDGNLIASGSLDNTVRLWDAQSGKPVGEPLTGHSGNVHAVAVSPDARWLASGADDMKVHIWDIVEGRSATVGPFRCEDFVYALAFSRDGKLIAAGDGSGHINVWSSETGNPALQSLQTSLNLVRSICFSPDGAYIASGGLHSRSEHVQICNVGTGQRSLSLRGHTDIVHSVVYSTDGRIIGTGSNDWTVRLWSTTTGVQIAVLAKHSSPVQSVAFNPNGQSIVSASEDKTIRIWDLTGPPATQLMRNDDITAALYLATLHNGWLRAPSEELLLWVPKEYHEYLRMMEGSQRVHILVGEEGWHRGNSWTSCWRASRSDVTARVI